LKHWQNIRRSFCVDFSLMEKNSAGHKKYLTKDAVKQLLKVNDVRFICRYMPKETKGAFKDWKTWGKQYKLSFVKRENDKIAGWYSYGDPKNTTENDKDGGGWLQVYSKGRYVVAKTENGKRRLLWNRATLEDILDASKEEMSTPKRKLLAAFSGRMQNQEDCSYKYENLPTEKKNKNNEDANKDAEPLVPYEPIDIIDFTIGDKDGVFTFGGGKHTWGNVHKSINSFCNAVSGVDNNTYDNVVEYELKYKLEADKKLSDAERSELKEQLRLMEQLQSTELKKGIQAWNEKNKGLQLVDHLDFMEQWALIEGDKKWKEENKLLLISKLGLEKPSIRMLEYPDLLKRMFQWEPDVRKAFTKQWNKAHENKKNKNDTKPLLKEEDAVTQEFQISENLDKDFVRKLERQLRLVELLSLLDEAPAAKRHSLTSGIRSIKRADILSVKN